MRFLYFTVSSSILIGLVLVIRTFFKKQLSPAAIYALWLIPAVRLLLPFSYIDLPGLNASYEWFQQGVTYIADGDWRPESGNASAAVPYTDREQQGNVLAEDIPVPAVVPAGTYGSVPQTAETAGEYVPDTAAGSRVVKGFDNLPRTEQIYLLLWLCGSIVVGSYALLSNRRLGRTVRHMDMDRGDSPLPVCLSNAVVAPCLFGLFQPRILLNWKVKENPELYHQVLRHELTHYRQKDHIWTFVRILLCVVYWWNPFVWVGAVCSREDAELACDQRVTRDLDTKGKREYGLALLLLLQQTWNQPTILYSATSMHGQGNSLKRRIESITGNRKTKEWVLLPVCLVLAVFLLAGCSMPSNKSWIQSGQFSTESVDGEAGLCVEYKYDLKEEIQSSLYYYEIYEQGRLVERHLLAYGDLGENRSGEQILSLVWTEDEETRENGHYVILEEDGAQTRMKLQLPLENSADGQTRTSGSYMESKGKKEVHAGDDLVLLADNDQTVLIHMVLSDLPENELAAQYQTLINPEEMAAGTPGVSGDETEQTESDILTRSWAEAFCGRDGEAIFALSSEETRQQMQDEMLMDIMEDGAVSFGWSSPWPGMFTDEGYRILETDENGAEILYYAGVSDPHLTVWRERLTFARENEKLLVTSSEIQFLDDISTSEEFFRAYPGGEITGTVMDYAVNGLGTYLNDHAMERTDMESYQLLKDPKLAVCSLLNLGRPWNEDTEGEPRKVEISLEEADGRTIAQITFLEDGGTVEVQMVQPYGKDGIWIPETASFPWSAANMEITVSDAEGSGANTELTYTVPGWAEAYQPEISAEIREANAQKALQELYELTGYRVESCFYTSTDNGGYCFAKNPDDMEHGRTFYSRYFKDESYDQSIPSMDMSSARRVWYSDVQQLLKPENADQMTNGELAIWFLQRSGIYQGEEIAGTGLVFETEPELIKVITADRTFYEVQVDREIQAVSSIYGPYPEGFEH